MFNKQLVFSLFFLTIVSSSLGAQSKVSLLDHEWTASYDWISDFEYERNTTRQQGKDVIDYTMDMKIRHVELLASRHLPWLQPTPSADQNLVIGYSYGWPDEPRIKAQPIFGFQITDPETSGEKMKVILTGSNHGAEATGCWGLHAMIEFLVSEDERAQHLRENIIFYVYPVVNPDGKVIKSRGSPELDREGETDHNRVWHTEGQFSSIDMVKNALIKDTGGNVDYLLDFHGVPRSSFCFVDESAAHSPYARALLGRGEGMTLRYSTDFGPRGYANSPGVLPTWAVNDDRLNLAYGFTPEIADSKKKKIFDEGQFFALAFYDLITNQVKPLSERRESFIPPEKPPTPTVAWLLNGSVDPQFSHLLKPVSQTVQWSEEGPFSHTSQGSLFLDGESVYIDFGEPSGMDLNDALTVALWVRSDSIPTRLSYLISRYHFRGDRRSWALVQRPHTREIQVVISSDGSHDNAHIKRYLSSLWPASAVFDGEWRHLAFTYRGGANDKLRLYVDGIELSPQGREAHIFNSGNVPSLYQADAPLMIGTIENYNDFFDGLISEVAIWDSTLSPEEVKWLSQNSISDLSDN